MPFEPDKINREYILKAVERIKKEDIELKSSTVHDVIIEGQRYPPKDILRYAHEEMNGENLWSKDGGKPTNKFLKSIGFEIMPKENKNEELHELKQDFLNAWPLERVKSMEIDDYTNLDKDDSFCYWLESKTEKLGSIWGGTSYKFGIYKRENTDSNDSRKGYATDGEYAWVSKYGNTVQEVFENVRSKIVSVIEAVQSDELSKIDGVDLGSAIKWKIAFQYSDERVVNIFKEQAIRFVGKAKGFGDADSSPISSIHKYLIDLKPEGSDYFDYTKELWDEYEQFETGTKAKTDTEESSSGKIQPSLNQILFGPPGTGKTYNTVNKAMQIVAPEIYKEHQDNRGDLTKKFRELLITDWDNVKQGQIAMTTFHQSFTYEDFIEGIKPYIEKNNDSSDSQAEKETNSNSDLGNISYRIEDGIFKKISELARQDSGGEIKKTKGKIKWSREHFEKAEFYKLSLGNVNLSEDEEIYEYCINKNKIAIGFLWDFDLTDVEESEIYDICKENSEYDSHDCISMAMFRHHLKKDYYVIISSGNHKFRAIGKITGDYVYDPDSPIRYSHFREVEWLTTDLDLSVNLVYNKNFSQKTIYHLRKKDIKPEFFVQSKQKTIDDQKSYVLIIDEINRGNIAQIFGELITLIEEDKREGKKEQLEVSLPYSKQPFSVPSNLHIIGTMNTADRSIEALDTALRRRFTFEELPPDPNIIINEGKNNEIEVNESIFELSEILNVINKRVEKLLDKDHMIGHSYFMSVEEASDLRIIFQRNIIPLLEEYFYGDKGKIQLVLGQGFINQSKTSGDADIFAASDYEASVFDDREVWELTTDWKKSEKDFEKALNMLLKSEI